MLNVEQALELLLSSITAELPTSFVPLDKALNCILATDVRADINVPEFNNSAMDGYVIALKPEQVNITKELSFAITDRIVAGALSTKLKAGSAARIFTGAAIPEGGNSVIMQEECILSPDKQKVTIKRPMLTNENIRPLGNDIQKGNIILLKGKQLQPQDIALAASVGIDNIKVFTKIKVGVFFTGDELIEPGNSLPVGKIFNSNRYALVALLSKLSCEVINLGNIKDTLLDTCNALKKLGDCNLIITTGGVSVGEEDYIKEAVNKLGKLHLWRINIKPGKPLAFGNIANTKFIGLPGNPVSTLVTFWLFARPLIKKIQGASKYLNHSIKVKTNFAWHNLKPRREFVRVKLDNSSIIPLANLYPKQGSDVLSSVVWADGLLEIPENSTFIKGKVLNFYPLKELLE